ncbi:MAG: chorismate lyase [Magnetococcales bacterium]|nr:chorismate lyase [Magnetococcales bacterium]
MSLPFVLQFRHPWQSPHPLLIQHQATLADPLRAALLHAGSLTDYLEQLWQQPVVVRLEQQQVATALAVSDSDDPVWSGYPLLDSSAGLLSRAAWLHVAGRDRLFASSQLALAGLSQSLRDRIERGQQPLGTLFLEQAASVARERLELALVTAPQLAQRLDQPAEQLFWCRRSLFYAGTARARIVEIFLPGFQDDRHLHPVTQR